MKLRTPWTVMKRALRKVIAMEWLDNSSSLNFQTPRLFLSTSKINCLRLLSRCGSSRFMRKAKQKKKCCHGPCRKYRLSPTSTREDLTHTKSMKSCWSTYQDARRRSWQLLLLVWPGARVHDWWSKGPSVEIQHCSSSRNAQPTSCQPKKAIKGWWTRILTVLVR